MPDLWLAQYLCERRHCLVAMAYDQRAHTDDDVANRIRREMADRGIRAVCALCGSVVLHFEHARLAVQNWDAAIRQLRAAEADQQRTRLWIESTRN